MVTRDMKLKYRLHHVTHFHWWKLGFRLLQDKVLGHKIIDAKSDIQNLGFCLRCKTFMHHVTKRTTD